MSVKSAVVIDRPIRRFRHWKQRFNPNARFVARRPITWQDETYSAGQEIPQGLYENKTKLRRFWKSKFIELMEFEEVDVISGQSEVDSTCRGSSKADGKGSNTRTENGGGNDVDSTDGDSDHGDANPAIDPLLKGINFPQGMSVVRIGRSWFEITYFGQSFKVNGRAGVENLVAQFESDQIGVVFT